MSSAPARPLFLSFLLGLLARADSAPVPAVVPEVSLSANISSQVIREDELLPFIITIKNKADEKIASGIAVNSITLWKLPDSYRLDDSQQICVIPILPPRTQPCETSQAFFASHNLIASYLPPGGLVKV